MGFFSQECEGCGFSILSIYAAAGATAWMTQAVAIQPGGEVVTGTYDGYGRLDGVERDRPDVGEAAQVWHEACWKLAGEPTTYEQPSPRADDQGYFIDTDEYARAEPRA